jgi:dihydroxyacetone kinase-like predicted kinase
VDKLREELQMVAESTLVVGDEVVVRVHGHTEDPGQLLSLGIQFGRLERISIEDMDAQHASWLQSQVEDFPVLATAADGEAESRDSASDELLAEIATIAVAPGAGIGDVFRSLGAAEIVPGGQSMNPSARDILEAAERARARTVIVLPNNGNVVTTAQHAAAAGLSEGAGPKLLVVPTRTVPQGIAAQLAFTPDGDADAAVASMTAAAGAVRTVEITRATRSVTIDGLTVREGDAIGLLDDKLVAAATSAVEAAKQALGCAEAGRAELITVYRGAGVPESDAEGFQKAVKELYPDAEVELIAGDQPHYDYIISVE